jgi:hypothetical protein
MIYIAQDEESHIQNTSKAYSTIPLLRYKFELWPALLCNQYWKKKFVSLIPVGRSYTLELSSGQQKALLVADNTKVLTV